MSGGETDDSAADYEDFFWHFQEEVVERRVLKISGDLCLVLLNLWSIFPAADDSKHESCEINGRVEVLG